MSGATALAARLKADADTGSPGCRSRCSPSASTSSPSTCAERQGSPLAPRAADARRPAPPHAALSATPRPRGLPVADSQARPPSLSAPGTPRDTDRARHPGTGLRPRQRGQGDHNAGRPARAHERARLLHGRGFQPDCAPISSTSTRRCSTASRAGRPYGSTRSPATPWSQRAFRERLGVSIAQLSDFEPKGEACRAFGVYHPGGFPQRARDHRSRGGIVRAGAIRRRRRAICRAPT